MYTSGESVEYDYSGNWYFLTEILDPEGIVICHVAESEVEIILSHLNRG